MRTVILIDFTAAKLDRPDPTPSTILQCRSRTNVLQETLAANGWKIHTPPVSQTREFETCFSIWDQRSEVDREESDWNVKLASQYTPFICSMNFYCGGWHADHLSADKFYNLTEPFLRSITEPTGREEFPFDLSQEEMQIVSHFRSSSLILGRSGTGKTTCLVFKILAKYKARQSVPDERPIRQVSTEASKNVVVWTNW